MVAHRFRLAPSAPAAVRGVRASEPALTDAVHSKLLEPRRSPPPPPRRSRSRGSASCVAVPRLAALLRSSDATRPRHGGVSASWLTEKTSLPRAALALDETLCAEGCAILRYRPPPTSPAGRSTRDRRSRCARTRSRRCRPAPRASSSPSHRRASYQRSTPRHSPTSSPPSSPPRSACPSRGSPRARRAAARSRRRSPRW